jgi:hypothetical protein
MRNFYLSILTTLFFVFLFSSLTAQMRITEYQYNGSEFVEFTNTGSTIIDMNGWSFDDDSRLPGTVSLSAFGQVRAGESVILCEATATAFRTLWNLCSNIKVIGSNPANLGRADEINLFDASGTLADRLTYNDQGTAPLGGPRTDVSSAWVPQSAMGNNTHNAWVLSTLNDAEVSFAATSGGHTGSPGKSARATVSYNPCAPGLMRITEYQYNGSEFVELTNVGGLPVNMTGWSFDDNSRTAGSFPLDAFGSVAGGESVIIAEAAAPAFRSLWNICDGIKVIGGNSQNLGRSDEINIYDNSGTLIDRLTYNDQGSSPQGGPRTDVNSAWVPASAMGNNTHINWVLSSVGDVEGSFAASSGGFTGSPGKSARATISFNPCAAAPGGAPTINIDVVATSNFIDAGATVPPASPFAVSAVTGDATDPLKTTGIDFIISDDITPVAGLTVTATSSKASVVPNTNLVITGTGAHRILTITPVGVGYSTITVTVTDAETNSRTYLLNYAASSAANTAYVFPTGIADASAAIPLDENYMLIANDETNILYVYDRRQSGLPVKTFDINGGNLLGLTDGSSGNWKEVDIEAAAASRNIANRIYWIGSLGNGTDGDLKPNRDRIFATNISGTGVATGVTAAGTYGSLRTALINWGNTHGYNLSASAQNGHAPKTIDGFNVEGMVFAPDGTTMYIGFRAPLVPAANRTKALIAPIQNFETWFNNGAPSGSPAIGAPIELTLGNRGIRDIIRLSNGTYVIVAGSYNDNSIPAIFRWSGIAGQEPLLVPSFNVTGLNAEAVLPVVQSGAEAFDKLQIICDNGDHVYYNDGTVAKDLPNDSHKKFINYIVQSSEGNVLPVHFIAFTALRSGADVRLYWNYTGSSPVQQFEILRSTDGSGFQSIAVLNGNALQNNFQFLDAAAGAQQLYYRIVAKDMSGQSYLSGIKQVNSNEATMASIFPNPVSTQLFISTAVNGVKTARIFSSYGALVKSVNFSGHFSEISTTGWSKGIYFISLLNSKGELIKQEKLVVQ